MRPQAKVLISCLLVSIGSTGGVADCSPSSCGQLQDIRYPFRLKDDPPKCGNPSFELTCDHNRTILDFGSRKYYVKSISYGDKTIQIVDTIFAGGCRLLPYQPSNYTTEPENRLDYYTWNPSFATFMNCTRKIESINHRPVPCLSGNNMFVYVALNELEGYSIADLAPSCRLLARVACNSLAGIEGQVLEFLQEGIHLSWYNNKCISLSSLIAYCYVETGRCIKGEVGAPNNHPPHPPANIWSVGSEAIRRTGSSQTSPDPTQFSSPPVRMHEEREKREDLAVPSSCADYPLRLHRPLLCRPPAPPPLWLLPAKPSSAPSPQTLAAPTPLSRL